MPWIDVDGEAVHFNAEPGFEGSEPAMSALRQVVRAAREKLSSESPAPNQHTAPSGYERSDQTTPGDKSREAIKAELPHHPSNDK